MPLPYAESLHVLVGGVDERGPDLTSIIAVEEASRGEDGEAAKGGAELGVASTRDEESGVIDGRTNGRILDILYRSEWRGAESLEIK